MNSLKTLAVACLIAFAEAKAQAQTAPLPFVLTEVGPGVYAAIDGPDHRSGSNAGFIVGDDAVLVVDSFFNPDAATALLGEIRRITGKPIRYVVNTHYHVDHVSGDAVFKAAGATIIAHRNVPGWIHGENIHLLGGDKIAPDLKARVEALPLPDRTIDKPIVLMLGKRRVAVQPVTGHTGGDLVVEVPDAKVLFAGDILWNHTGPTTIDGTVSKWTADLARLETLSDTVFVPGHGAIAGKKEVEDLRVFFGDLMKVTADARRESSSEDAVVAAASAKLIALHPDWPRLDRNAPFIVREMDQELAGTKRVPVPAP